MTAERDPWYPGGQRDAHVWTDEFFRIYPKGCDDPDTMLGWFANAIETGVMFGAQEARADLDAAIRDDFLATRPPAIVASIAVWRLLGGSDEEWDAIREASDDRA